MKKQGLFILCVLISAVLLSACDVVPKSPINYERKLGKYFEAEKTPSGTIDLSEGPKLRYDAKFGPQELNFDLKIINPY